MIHFVGAGPGAEDLITVRGETLLKRADVVVYAGSLVNPAHLARTKAGCDIHDSASMTLEQVMDVMIPAAKAGKTVVRLHTGDPSIYGAIREQMDWLDAEYRRLTYQEKSVILTQKETNLIAVFLEQPDTVQSRSQLLWKVWGGNAEVEDGNVDNYIHFLRKRLRELGCKVSIKTVYGAGYRLEETP